MRKDGSIQMLKKLHEMVERWKAELAILELPSNRGWQPENLTPAAATTSAISWTSVSCFALHGGASSQGGTGAAPSHRDKSPTPVTLYSGTSPHSRHQWQWKHGGSVCTLTEFWVGRGPEGHPAHPSPDAHPLSIPAKGWACPCLRPTFVTSPSGISHGAQEIISRILDVGIS